LDQPSKVTSVVEQRYIMEGGWKLGVKQDLPTAMYVKSRLPFPVEAAQCCDFKFYISYYTPAAFGQSNSEANM